MFEITKEQEALLRLPDPSTFFPLLCREIREEYSGKVGHLSDAALMDDVVKSHDHAAYVLRITHLPVLVRWVKADVACAGALGEGGRGMGARSAGRPGSGHVDAQRKETEPGSGGSAVESGRTLGATMGTRIIGPRPWLGPGMGGGNGSVDEDGNPVDPYGGPTTGDVADGIRDVVGDIQQRVRGKAKPDARVEPTAKAREVDCSQMPDETACNECLLKEGFIGPPGTGRYVTRRNLINYEYQLYIANLRSAPLRFGFMVADKADPARTFFSVDTLFDYLHRKGFSRTVQEWHFNACEFDGFWLKDCRVVEAKGRYEHFLDENGKGKYGFVEKGIFEPWGRQMTRQRAAITIAEPQGKLLWCFMQVRTMGAGINFAGIDPALCKFEPYSGEFA